MAHLKEMHHLMHIFKNTNTDLQWLLLSTVPNESYHLCSKTAQKYSFKMPSLPIILINFSWAKFHNFFIMEAEIYILDTIQQLSLQMAA